MAFSTLNFRAYIAGLSGRQLGAFKTAAIRSGVDLEEYIQRTEQNLKRCTDCNVWKDRSQFFVDRTRWDELAAKCCACGSLRGKETYEPVPLEVRARYGLPRAALRSGDAQQAMHLVNLDVQGRRRPNPNDLHCVLCGHKGDDRRHEYRHHMGYAVEHFFDVLPVCTHCRPVNLPATV